MTIYKNLLFTLLTIVSFQAVNAQWFSKERVLNNENFDKKRLRFGYTLGLNSYDYKIEYNERQFTEVNELTGEPKKDLIIDKGIGFNVGLLANLRITEYLDLRFEPGVIFPSRDITYPDLEDRNFREIKATYVHLPLLLKISTKRLNNFKPFLLAGISTSLNLSSNQDNPDDNASGQFRTKTNTNYYELGFGIDLYLPYFKFTPSIRGVFATSDELVRDKDPDSPYTSQIDKFSTRGVFLNFTFQ